MLLGRRRAPMRRAARRAAPPGPELPEFSEIQLDSSVCQPWMTGILENSPCFLLEAVLLGRHGGVRRRTGACTRHAPDVPRMNPYNPGLSWRTAPRDLTWLKPCDDTAPVFPCFLHTFPCFLHTCPCDEAKAVRRRGSGIRGP